MNVAKSSRTFMNLSLGKCVAQTTSNRRSNPRFCLSFPSACEEKSMVTTAQPSGDSSPRATERRRMSTNASPPQEAMARSTSYTPIPYFRSSAAVEAEKFSSDNGLGLGVRLRGSDLHDFGILGQYRCEQVSHSPTHKLASKLSFRCCRRFLPQEIFPLCQVREVVMQQPLSLPVAFDTLFDLTSWESNFLTRTLICPLLCASCLLISAGICKFV
mmetsp:Transcript_9581/g.19490  ORF Transcript_9581/g.19490 Transcript_9581/m.19490 type:complete len:215 (+) Transcript_9581:475-1119(+)